METPPPHPPPSGPEASDAGHINRSAQVRMGRATPCSSCTPCSVAVGGGGPQEGPHTPGVPRLRKAGGESEQILMALASAHLKTDRKKRNLGRRDWGCLSEPGPLSLAPRPLALISPKVSQCVLPRFLTGLQQQLLELLLILGAAQLCVGGQVGSLGSGRWGAGWPLSPASTAQARPSGQHRAREPLRSSESSLQTYTSHPQESSQDPRETRWGPRAKSHWSLSLQGPF